MLDTCHIRQTRGLKEKHKFGEFRERDGGERIGHGQSKKTQSRTSGPSGQLNALRAYSPARTAAADDDPARGPDLSRDS